MYSNPKSVAGSDRPQSLAQQQTNSESDFGLLYDKHGLKTSTLKINIDIHYSLSKLEIIELALFNK
jgi:hypothetical protein